MRGCRPRVLLGAGGRRAGGAAGGARGRGVLGGHAPRRRVPAHLLGRRRDQGLAVTPGREGEVSVRVCWGFSDALRQSGLQAGLHAFNNAW